MPGESCTNGSTASENLSFQKIVVVLGVTLMVVKFAAWMLTSSVAVLTDALESIVNVVAGFVGLYALYLSSCPRDKSHPYGHGKIELISSSVEGMMILVAGVMIIFEAVGNLMNPKEVTDLGAGLVLLAAAAAANYIVGYAAIKKGRRNRSLALVASGKHLCSDTLSSVGVIAGLILMLILSNAGYDVEWLDSVIAIVFGTVILAAGAKVVKESMDGVMDRTDEKIVGEVIELINSNRHDHWVDIHNLRVTKYGPSLHIELHMVLPKNMNLVDQEREIEEVYEAIRRKYGDNIEISVQGEPCSDLMCRYCGMDCRERNAGFISSIEWTAGTATDDDENHSGSKVDE